MSSAVWTILEKIVHDQLIESLKGYNKQCLGHFAFQKLHNTVACLLNVIDQRLKDSDEGKIHLNIFLDPKKAFDTVDHKMLLLKLRQYGFESSSCNWYTSHLTNREQLCYFDRANSRSSILKCGIPQGRCLELL